MDKLGDDLDGLSLLAFLLPVVYAISFLCDVIEYDILPILPLNWYLEFPSLLLLCHQECIPSILLLHFHFLHSPAALHCHPCSFCHRRQFLSSLHRLQNGSWIHI